MKRQSPGRERVVVDQLSPLLDSGYRAALLVTGSSAEAESALEEAAAMASRLCRAGAPAGRLRVTFYRLLLTACAALERPFGRAAREGDLTAAGLDLGPLARCLARLSNLHRAAIVLDLVDDFPPAEIAEILGCPRTTAFALIHLAYEEVSRCLGGAVLARAPLVGSGACSPNGDSQDRVTVTKYWE